MCPERLALVLRGGSIFSAAWAKGRGLGSSGLGAREFGFWELPFGGWVRLGVGSWELELGIESTPGGKNQPPGVRSDYQFTRNTSWMSRPEVALVTR